MNTEDSAVCVNSDSKIPKVYRWLANHKKIVTIVLIIVIAWFLGQALLPIAMKAYFLH